MELSQAIAKAHQILDEERLRPTTVYVDHGVNWTAEIKRLTEQLKAGEILKPEALAVAADGSRRLNISGMRLQDPRIVSETPEQYQFVSANYGFLLMLMNRVDKADVPAFVSAILARTITHGDYTFTRKEYHYPALSGKVSELPLIAEFAIRTGHTKELFEVLANAKDPTPGLALLIMQIVDTVSFNFTIIPEADLDLMQVWLQPLLVLAQDQASAGRAVQGQHLVKNPKYKPGRENEARMIVSHIAHLYTEIRQAMFFYLKGALQQSQHFEVESDKVRVQGFLLCLGFNNLMLQTLDAAEKIYLRDADGFELKSCLGHLRTFFENLHLEAATFLAALAKIEPPERFGHALNILRSQKFFTDKEEKFSAGIFGLISDEAVHSMISEREYARLLRNMVIEFGLLFLTIMEKRGIRLQDRDLLGSEKSAAVVI